MDVTPCGACATLTATVAALADRLTAIESRQPIEPWYTVQEALFLLHCSDRALRQRLTRHRAQLAPARYRITGTRRRQRLLTSDDLRFLRDVMTRGIRHGYVSRQAAYRAAQALAA